MEKWIAFVAAIGFLLGFVTGAHLMEFSYIKPREEAITACEKELPRNIKCGWRIETFVKENGDEN